MTVRSPHRAPTMVTSSGAFWCCDCFRLQLGGCSLERPPMFRLRPFNGKTPTGRGQFALLLLELQAERLFDLLAQGPQSRPRAHRSGPLPRGRRFHGSRIRKPLGRCRSPRGQRNSAFSALPVDSQGPPNDAERGTRP